MTRTYSIAIVAVLLVACVGGGIYVWLNRSNAPSTTGQVQPSGFPNVPEPTSGSVVPTTMQSRDAVISAFKTQGPTGDRIQPHQTSMSGGYALQVWVGDITGGETLLKFDEAQGGWVIVETIGGAYSVAGLHALGVPQKTVLALLKNLNI